MLIDAFQNWNDHLNQLGKLFNRLRNVGQKAKLPKCNLGVTNISYFGFRLKLKGIRPGVDN
jgi:hypothetical protein